MSCPDEQTLLMLVDDELDATESAAVEQHMAGCSDCREFVAQMRSLNQSGRSALRGMQVNAPPRAIHPRRVRLLRPLALAAAAIAIVVVSVTVWLSLTGNDGGVAQTPTPASTRPQIAATNRQRPAPPLLDEQFELWAARHRDKRIELVPLEEVAAFRPPQILPFNPEADLELKDYGGTP